MDSYHITFDKDKSIWQLKKEGGARSLKKAETKSGIMTIMKDYMSNKKGSVKIHKKDGKIQEERTYPRSADPRKSKG
jgi:hypothetical protein